MLSGAGRFSIPADWKLAQEVVWPEWFTCISTNSCPSLSRRLETGKELTANDVVALILGLGFDMSTDHPCEPPANGIGFITICISTGTHGEFGYWLSATSPASGEPQLVTLIVTTIMPDQLLLSLSLTPIFEIARRDALSGAPVGLVDVVLDVLAANAPHAPPSDLKSTQLPRPDETLDQALLHVQLVCDLGQGQETGLVRFVSHRAILCEG